MMKRARADAIIAQMTSAAEAINQDQAMMHWVSRLSVFGSYLTDKQVLGDLDIAFELSARWRPGEYDEMHRALLAAHPPPRYIAQDFIQRMFWPERLLLRRLRVGRGISFHEHGELDILEAPARPIYLRTRG